MTDRPLKTYKVACVSKWHPEKHWHIVQDFLTFWTCDCGEYDFKQTCKHIEKTKQKLSTVPVRLPDAVRHNGGNQNGAVEPRN